MLRVNSYFISSLILSIDSFGGFTMIFIYIRHFLASYIYL